MPCGACPTEVSRIVAKRIQQATLDDHSEVVPPLPIPNRTVKHLSADDSGRTSVKVGHRQALTLKTPQAQPEGFCLCANDLTLCAPFSDCLIPGSAHLSRKVVIPSLPNNYPLFSE